MIVTDEAKLIVNTLRACAVETQCSKCVVFCENNECLFTAAAKLIESLSAELEQVKQERDGLNILMEQTQSMLETRTRERDAVVENLKRVDVDCLQCKFSRSPAPCHESDFNCAECKVANCVCKDCTDNSNWQWRGIQEEHK